MQIDGQTNLRRKSARELVASQAQVNQIGLEDSDGNSAIHVVVVVKEPVDISMGVCQKRQKARANGRTGFSGSSAGPAASE